MPKPTKKSSVRTFAAIGLLCSPALIALAWLSTKGGTKTGNLELTPIPSASVASRDPAKGGANPEGRLPLIKRPGNGSPLPNLTNNGPSGSPAAGSAPRPLPPSPIATNTWVPTDDPKEYARQAIKSIEPRIKRLDGEIKRAEEAGDAARVKRLKRTRSRMVVTKNRHASNLKKLEGQ